MKCAIREPSASVPKNTQSGSPLNPLAKEFCPKSGQRSAMDNYRSIQDALRDMSSDVTLLDNVLDCRNAVTKLLNENEVAVDVEGGNLCRNGCVSLIQICNEAGHVFLFDITTMGKDAFSLGNLKQLLESFSVRKVLFDGRADNDALYHLFGVNMNKVYDLQILYTLTKRKKSDRFLKGLTTCMIASQVVPKSMAAELSSIKEKGKQLYAPERGGSYDVWDKRPLDLELVRYAAADVKYLLAMKEKWSSRNLDQRVEYLTIERIRKTINGEREAQGKYMCKRDFE